MASRASFPAIGRPIRTRPNLPSDWRQHGWTIATAPWWIWSDIPRLSLPARNPEQLPGGPAGTWVIEALDRISTRIWIQRMVAIVARGAGLALLAGCAWLAIALLGGPAFDQRSWLGAGIAIMLWALILAALSRPSRAETARMLDRSFDLQERIATALGNIGHSVPEEHEPASLVYLQIADAANAIAMAQHHPALRLRLPLRELILTIGLALTFAALALARGTGASVPDLQANGVPAFVPAAQRFVQPEAHSNASTAQDALSAEELQQMMQASLDQQEDLHVLADALADHAITSDAAELIRQGDYGAAASELRTVSAQADQLSESARADLAADLNQAAAQMSDDNQTLSGATEQAAAGLEDGGEAARSGMRDLANAVEQGGQQVSAPLESDQAMQPAQQSTSGASSASQSTTAGQNEPSTGQPASSDDQPAASSASGDQSGQAGEPGSAPGSEPSAGSGAESASSNGEPGNTAPADTGEPGMPGESSGSGRAQPAEGSSGGSAADAPSQSTGGDQSGTSAQSNQGSGAGTSGSQLDAQGISDSDIGGAAQSDSAGRAPAQPKESDAEQPEGQDVPAPEPESQVAVELSRADEGESVQIGGSSGGSSLGSGAGITVSSGSATQGEVGENGPDSNHVPSEYRDIVERYFSDKDRTE